MQESPYAAPVRIVAVTRPVAVRQLAAGLATVAAATAASGLALSLTTVEFGASEFSDRMSITRQAFGNQMSGVGSEDFPYERLAWGAPLVVAVALLTAAAVAALVASRTDRRNGWARLAQLLAVAGGAAAAGILAVLVAFGVPDVYIDNYDSTDRSVDTHWGPVPFVLGLAVVAAAAA